MDKTYYIAANWKMNGSVSFIRDFCNSLIIERSSGSFLKDFNNAFLNNLRNSFKPESSNINQMIICPPDIYLDELTNNAPDFIRIGSQNISSNDEGAFTGECSGKMLIDNQITHTIIGHSERREYHQESNELIKLKLNKAFDNSLIPILCIGESIKQREANQTFDVIEQQIRSVLDQKILSENKSILIAYEPIWAIGSGLSATPEMANEVHAYINKLLEDLCPSRDLIPILYGGSMKASNTKELLQMEHIHGGLIGGASLDATEFLKIYNIAEELRNG